MADPIALPHWTVAEKLPSTGNDAVDKQLQLRLQAIQENFEGLVSQAARQLEGALQQRVPPGIVLATAANFAPDGYLACDGSAVSRTTFADLFTEIGTAWGAGDGSTTFNLPNYNDTRFIRGNSVPSGTGGANTHSHAGHAHSVSVSGTTGSVRLPGTHGYTDTSVAGAIVGSQTAHDHSFSGNGTTDSVPTDSQSNVPTYRDMFFIIKT